MHYGRCASGKDRIKCILPLATIRQSAHEDLPKKFSATKKVMIYYWENKSALVCALHPFLSLKSKYLITNQSQEIKRRYGKARNYFTEEGQRLYKYIFGKLW